MEGLKKIFVVNSGDGRGRAYDILAFRFIRFFRDRVIPAIFSRTLQHPPSPFPASMILAEELSLFLRYRYLENFFHDSSTNKFHEWKIIE